MSSQFSGTAPIPSLHGTSLSQTVEEMSNNSNMDFAPVNNPNNNNIAANQTTSNNSNINIVPVNNPNNNNNTAIQTTDSNTKKDKEWKPQREDYRWFGQIEGHVAFFNGSFGFISLDLVHLGDSGNVLAGEIHIKNFIDHWNLKTTQFFSVSELQSTGYWEPVTEKPTGYWELGSWSFIHV